MPVWIPIALAVAAVAAIGASSRRDAHPVVSGADAPKRVPTGIEVFNAFLRKGLEPPREIAEIARDEAADAGIVDLAMQIERQFDLGPRRARAAQAVGPGAFPAPAPARIGRAVQPSDATLLGVPNGQNAGSAQAGGADAALLGVPQAAQLAPVAATPAIPGVTAEQWAELCARLEREVVGYDSARHVGRYRQSKDRLRELGIDPASIVNNPGAQDDALVADLTDAYGHLARGGVLERVLGKPIALPDVADMQTVMLSGILAVCTAGGLDACASWLRSKADRARFRHTTNLFLRCNGIF